jgi:hypothetical protein
MGKLVFARAARKLIVSGHGQSGLISPFRRNFLEEHTECPFCPIASKYYCTRRCWATDTFGKRQADEYIRCRRNRDEVCTEGESASLRAEIRLIRGEPAKKKRERWHTVKVAQPAAAPFAPGDDQPQSLVVRLSTDGWPEGLVVQVSNNGRVRLMMPPADLESLLSSDAPGSASLRESILAACAQALQTAAGQRPYSITG